MLEICITTGLNESLLLGALVGTIHCIFILFHMHKEQWYLYNLGHLNKCCYRIM